MSVLPPAPIKADPGTFVWEDWYRSLRNSVNGVNAFLSLPRDPTASDIGNNSWAIVKNTVTGVISIWVNDAGAVSRLYAFALASPG